MNLCMISKTDLWLYADRFEEGIEARITPNGSPCSGRPQSILPNIIQAVVDRELPLWRKYR